MKRLLSIAIVIALSMMLSLNIFAFDYAIIGNSISNDENIKMIEFIEEYFTDLNIKRKYASMIDGISETDVLLKSEDVYYDDGYFRGVDEEVSVENVGFTISRECYKQDNNEYVLIEAVAFELFPDEFKAYVSSVNTLEKALNSYNHFEYSEEYFDNNEYVLLNPINLNAGHEGESVIRYHSDKEKWIPEPSFMDTSVPNYVVYMQDPYTIEIGYNWNTMYAPYNPAWKRIERTYIKLNYEQDKIDASDCELVSIEIELSYFDKYSAVYAPQTGFTTAIYAAVAVVSAAAVVAIGKKRR